MQHAKNEHNSYTSALPTVMRLTEVVRVIGLSRASIYRLVVAGEFPRQFKIGTSAVGWLREEIEAWIIERAGQRQDPLREIAHAISA
jgi:prophage regulatory protein